MKIAYIGQKGLPAKSGGVEKHVEEMASRMVANGHSVFAYARNNYVDKDLNSYKGIQIIHLPSIPTKNLDAISHTFLAIVHAIFSNYDVVHFHSIGPSSLIFLLKIFKRKTAIVTTHHCQDYFHKKWGSFAKKYLRFGEAMAVLFSDRLIVVSKNLKEYIQDKFRKTATVITNGTSVVPAQDSNYLSKWNLQKGSYIIYVGRFIRHKGIHLLVEAFKNIEDKHLARGKKLVVIGDGFHTDEYVKELKDTARGRENIIFTGTLTGDELAQLFSHAYIFVQPSQSEGMSLALLEAMGYGRPILASDIKENKEPLGEGTAMFFHSNDTKDLEEKLTYLINNPLLAKKMGETAQEKAQEEYSWDRLAVQLEEVYSNAVLEKKNPQFKTELR